MKSCCCLPLMHTASDIHDCGYGSSILTICMYIYSYKSKPLSYKRIIRKNDLSMDVIVKLFVDIDVVDIDVVAAICLQISVPTFFLSYFSY